MNTRLLLIGPKMASLLCLLASFCCSHAGLIVQNLGSGGFGVSAYQVVGQSFTAEDRKIQTIGFYLESYIDNAPHAQVKCELLEGEGFGGAVLATAVIQAPPGFKDFRDFDLASAPALAVGAKYTARLSPVGTNQFSVGWNQVWNASDPYAGGHAFVNGGAHEYQDLRFRIIPAGLEAVFIGFETTQLVALEPDQGISIAVKRSGSTEATAQIAYQTAVPFLSGAVPGKHYQAQQGSLRFDPGESSKTIFIPITNDETFDTNKVLDVELSSTDSSVLLNISRLRVEIRDDDGIQLFFTEPNLAVAEDAGNATITVERYGKPQQALTLLYEFQNGSAINGEDFIAAPGELTIGPNQTRASFVVAVLPDRQVEGEEDFYVRVSSPTVNTNLSAWVRLSDRTALAEFPFAVMNVSESAGTVQIPVVRRGYEGKEMTLAYRTEPLTATGGQDYTSAEGQIAFAAGELEKRIELAILDDTVAEPTESFLVKLLPSGPVDYLGNRAAISVSLSNHSSIVYLASTNVTVSESGASARVILKRGGLLSIESTVLFVTSGPGSAEPGVDYTPRSVQVTFAPGQTEAAIEIPILDDLLPEPDEMFTVNISAGSANLTLTNREAQITLIDNSSIVGFASTNLSVLETGGSLVVDVRRTGDVSQASAVDYATEDGTARAGVHYTAASGVLKFAAGESVKQIVVPIIDNDLPESDVLFAIRLLNPTQESKLGTASTARVVIGNDDQTVQFASANFPAFIGSDSARITLNRGPGALGTVQVRVTTSDGAAKAGEDYQSVDRMVQFEPGESSITVAVPLIGSDGSEKIGRQFSVRISEPIGARLGNATEGTVTFTAVRSYHYDYAFADRAAAFGDVGSPSLIGVQPGGKIIFRQSNLQRANADGSPDLTFQAAESIFSAVLQSHGEILWGRYLGGEYIIKRLTKDGAADPTFSTFGTGSYYSSLWVDPQDRIYFQRANDIGRASKDGAVETGFSIPPASLAFDAGGKIYAFETGVIRKYSPEGILEMEARDPDGMQIQSLSLAPGGKPVYIGNGLGGARIRRLTRDLALDPSWDETASRSLKPRGAIALSDGKILANVYDPKRSRLLLFDEDGRLNEEFERARPFRGDFSVLEQAPGSIVLPGGFLDFEFNPTPGLIRYSIFAEPALSFARERYRVYHDQAFASATVQRKGPLDAPARVQVRAENGSLKAGIDFSESDQLLQFRPEEESQTTRRVLLQQPSPIGNFFLVLDTPEGALPAKPARAEVQVLPVPAGEFVLDLGFNARTGPENKRSDVGSTFAIQPGTGLLVSIFMPRFGAGDMVVRMKSDGSLDDTFAPIGTQTTNGIRQISVQGDRIYLTGAYWWNLRRYLAEGAPDPAFAISSSAFPYASAMLKLPSGKLLLGAGSIIARLNDDGSEDQTFARTTITQSNYEPISEIVLQPDGKALVAGATLSRIKPEGGVDTSFSVAAPDRYISDIALQPDGKILVGGGFSSIGRKPANGLARLNPDGSRDDSFAASLDVGAWVYSIALQPNGSMVIGGNFQKNLKRLTASGAEDATFTSVAPNAAVTKVEFEDSENLLISGYFTEPGQGMARLTTRRNAARFSTLSLTPAGALKVRLQGKSGLSYQLLRSSNLESWEMWMSTNLPADTVDFTVPTQNTESMFLRAVQGNPPGAR